MEKKFQEIIKTDYGNGKLFEESRFIDDVTYHYKITQEFIVYESNNGKEKIPGLKDVAGSIQLIHNREDILGKNLILFLADNTKWNIVTFNGDFIDRHYQFKFGPGNENI
jgi:hypothetical protein